MNIREPGGVEEGTCSNSGISVAVSLRVIRGPKISNRPGVGNVAAVSYSLYPSYPLVTSERQSSRPTLASKHDNSLTKPV